MASNSSSMSTIWTNKPDRLQRYLGRWWNHPYPLDLSDKHRAKWAGILIAFRQRDCLEQWCRWLTYEARQRQCPSHGKPDSRRQSSAIPRLGMSSQSQSSAYREEKIRAFNRIHQSMKSGVAPIKECHHQHRSDLITFLELRRVPEPNLGSWNHSPWHVVFRLRKIKDNKPS